MHSTNYSAAFSLLLSLISTFIGITESFVLTLLLLLLRLHTGMSESGQYTRKDDFPLKYEI